MNIKFIRSLAVIAYAWAMPVAEANVQVAERHVFMLNAGKDTVWGSYMFGVKNSGSEPAVLRASVVLPDETVDFEPQDGLKKEELMVDEDGGLYFQKSFSPGLTLVAIGFQIPASFGNTEISFRPTYGIEQFSVLAKANGLLLTPVSSIMGEAEETNMSGTKYMSLHAVAPLQKGKKVTISVRNIPQGRAQFWVVASLFAGLLVLLAIGLGYKTRNLSGQKAFSVS